MDDNPFVDPTDVNPFDDQNIGNKQAAVLEIDDRTDNPFHESGNTNTDISGTIGAATSAATQDLRARQAELDRKEAELRRREAQLNNNSSTAPREKNWPPLPAWSPVKPCIYHDIDMEIPQEFQGTVRKMYHIWLAYVGILAINCICFVIVMLIPNPSGSDPTPATPIPPVTPSDDAAPTNGTGTVRRRRAASDEEVSDNCKVGHELYMVWFSLVWFAVFAPASILWYRALYKAFRDDSSFQFFLFFFIYFFQLIFHIIQAIGANDMGFGGWIQVFTFMGCNIFSGILMLIPAIGFTGMSVNCIMQMIKIHDIYRSSGKTLGDAQKEWATGVMQNPTVQGYAQEAAADVMRNQMQGVSTGR